MATRSIFVDAVCLALLILECNRFVKAEIFSSMNDVENVLYAEQEAVDAISRYIQRQQKKLEGLKRFSDDCHQSQDRLKSDPAMVTNPLHTYLLTKRLQEFSLLKKMIKHNDADVFLKNITQHRQFAGGGAFPDQQDYIGAAQALFRLQDTYKLSAKSMADSRIPGVAPGEKLSAFECYELGRVAYLRHPPDYYHTLLWTQEALNRLKTEVYPSVREVDVLAHLSYAMYHQENVERATVMARRIKKLDPKSTNIDDNLEFYELELQAMHKDPKTVSERNLPPLNLIRPPPENSVPDFDTYEELCRGEIQMSEGRKAKLYCYYKRNRPFLKLAPLKAEVIHLRPKMTIFRQVVSEIESAIIKELAGPLLARAMIENRHGEQETATYRVSKSTWFRDSADIVIAQISRRVEDMSDLTTATAEELQIANYGLGGHYEPHFDFAEEEEVDAFKDMNVGNRIATAMFYLSQPLAGGSTVFPQLKLAIPPSKHDAIVWYNLYKSGRGDGTLRHAACPVLAGNKWVANKWLHEYGQEFLRPCDLRENEYE